MTDRYANLPKDATWVVPGRGYVDYTGPALSTPFTVDSETGKAFRASFAEDAGMPPERRAEIARRAAVLIEELRVAAAS